MIWLKSNNLGGLHRVAAVISGMLKASNPVYLVSRLIILAMSEKTVVSSSMGI